MIVDSHCHLDYPGLAEREDEVIEAADAAGVRFMVTIATRQHAWRPVIELAGRHAQVVCALGIHPHHVAEDVVDDPDAIVDRTSDADVVAVGESGLDYHYDFAPRERQAASFRVHIEAARRSHLPLIVHTRDADEDTMDILEAEMARGEFKGVIHCYSSSRRLAERAVELGLYLGVGGILTFKRSQALRDTIADMPLDRLLLETDAPYLAPEPHRGKTNEPAYVTLTATTLAQLRDLSVEEVVDATTDNFFRLFSKAAVYRPAL